MTVSGAVFLAGASKLLTQFPLLKVEANFATVALVVCGLVWSGRSITPDLLESGLVLAALAPFLGADWPSDTRTLAVSSLLLAAAFLAKAIALPFGVITISLRAAAAVLLEGVLPALVLRGFATLAGFGSLIVGPWILTLSTLAHHFVWSDAGWINFAKTGPYYALGPSGELRDDHASYMQFHQPRPGRWTSWENPPEMVYVKWSPLHSISEFKYYIRVVYRSITGIIKDLSAVDFFGFGLVFLIVNQIGFSKNHQLIKKSRWMAGLLPVLTLLLIYCPFLYWGDIRYFWVAVPIMIGAAMVGLRVATTKDGSDRSYISILTSALVCLSFVMPSLPDIGRALTRTYSTEQSDLGPANDYAKLLSSQHLAGQVAGAGFTVGVRASELAFAMGTTFGGAMVDPHIEDVLGARSKVFLVPSGTELERALRADRRFRPIEGQGIRHWDGVSIYIRSDMLTQDTGGQHGLPHVADRAEIKPPPPPRTF